MTYAVKRYLGYEPWGVVNPWGYADLSQPQRRRVPSKYVWQTHPPRAGMHPLGIFETRESRMEVYSVVGLSLSAFIVWSMIRNRSKTMTRNKRARRR